MGCSNGLAYIDDGYGSVLKIQFVEKLFTKESEEEGKAGSLSQTGRLGEVMKESVEIVKIAVYNFLT